MADITHGTWIKDGKAVDAVYQSGTKVYGRNLYLNSKAIPDNYGGSSGVTVEAFDSNTNMWHIVAEKGSGSLIGLYLYTYANDKIPNNSDWSYSADVKGTGKAVEFGIEAGNKNPIVGTIGSAWSRISQTGKIDEVKHKTIVMYFDSTNSPIDVYIKLPKLELSKTPTPWTPAPKEVLK